MELCPQIQNPAPVRSSHRTTEPAPLTPYFLIFWPQIHSNQYFANRRASPRAQPQKNQYSTAIEKKIIEAYPSSKRNLFKAAATAATAQDQDKSPATGPLHQGVDQSPARFPR